MRCVHIYCALVGQGASMSRKCLCPWRIIPKTQDMTLHPVTPCWHRTNQSCSLALTPPCWPPGHAATCMFLKFFKPGLMALGNDRSPIRSQILHGLTCLVRSLVWFKKRPTKPRGERNKWRFSCRIYLANVKVCLNSPLTRFALSAPWNSKTNS